MTHPNHAGRSVLDNDSLWNPIYDVDSRSERADRLSPFHAELILNQQESKRIRKCALHLDFKKFTTVLLACQFTARTMES